MTSKGLLLKGFVFFVVLWHLSSILVNSPALPTPLSVFRLLPELLSTSLPKHIQASAMRLFKGIGIATLVGFAIGLMMGKSKQLNRVLNPLIYFTYPIPKTALLPVFMILFGLGDGSKVMLITVITVFQIIVTVRDATLAIPESTYIPLRSLGASPLQTFIHVTWMSVLPDLLTSIRLAVGTGLSILFFAENFGTNVGLGYYIQDMWNRMNYPAMYAGIFTLALMGFTLFVAIDYLEHVATRWKE